MKKYEILELVVDATEEEVEVICRFLNNLCKKYHVTLEPKTVEEKITEMSERMEEEEK